MGARRLVYEEVYEDANIVQGVTFGLPDEGCDNLFTWGRLRGDLCPVPGPAGLEPGHFVSSAPLSGVGTLTSPIIFR